MGIRTFDFAIGSPAQYQDNIPQTQAPNNSPRQNPPYNNKLHLIVEKIPTWLN